MPSSNFLTEIIKADLEADRHGGKVVTRFPPEPNGYLHIGHAKSICLNFGLAERYGGVCHLRYDDTNPSTEEQEYVDSIARDIRWLGFDWGEKRFFASDYFLQMYDYAVSLIEKGKAYVCSLSEEEARAGRGTIYEPGRLSPYAARSVEESRDLFARMRAGDFEEGTHVLRARIDMASPNMLMRDPVLYRIRHRSHHRTGDDWCIYPMYDYAHCLEDAFEGVTHSICTLEFENNRELYDWVLDQAEWDPRPRQYEFARLNLDYTVVSKRKLLQLVDLGIVSGWDDPRMPTLAGLRRRGVTPESIRALAEMVGVAKANSVVDIGKLEYCIRDDLNRRAPRVMCVSRPLKVVLTNYPEEQREEIEAPSFPDDVGREGSRKVPFSKHLYIERTDFASEPPPRWHRLAPGREVRLRYGYFIRCEEVVHDPDTGEVTELRCTYDPATRGGSAPDGRKVKGTLHWVSAEHALPCEVRLYDRLFAVPRPDGDPEVDFKTHVNPKSLVVEQGALIEPSVGEDSPGTRYQFERLGYFARDEDGAGDGRLVYNRVITLRDSWAKIAAPAKTAAAPPAAPKEKKPARPSERDLGREADPELARRHRRYEDELGIGAHEADVLSGDRAVSDLFEAVLAAGAAPAEAARWTVHEILRLLKDSEPKELPFGAPEIAELVGLVSDGRITAAAAKEVVDEMARAGESPAAIVSARGLEAHGDDEATARVVAEVLATNPDEVARYRAGEAKLLGFFMGQVMRAAAGKADPADVRRLLQEQL